MPITYFTVIKHEKSSENFVLLSFILYNLELLNSAKILVLSYYFCMVINNLMSNVLPIIAPLNDVYLSPPTPLFLLEGCYDVTVHQVPCKCSDP